MRAFRLNIPKLFMLLTVFLAVLLCFVFASPSVANAAEERKLIEADLTFNGEKLPSTIVYTGSPCIVDYSLWESTDGTTWAAVPSTIDTKYRDTNDAYLEIRYYNTNNVKLSSAPTNVGTYIVKLIAIKNSDANDGYSFSASDIFATKTFSIVYDNLAIVSPTLDESATLNLDDAHTDFATAIRTDLQVVLGGTQLVKNTNYTLSFDFYNAAWTPTSTVAAVGKYRATITFNASANAAIESAIGTSSLKKVSNKYVMYREFNVGREVFSIELDTLAMYEDNIVAVDLTSASKTKLLSGYGCKVYKKVTNGGNGTNLLVVDSPNTAFTPSEVGEYVYRVTFSNAKPEYGIAVGDYIDLNFVVKAKPYYVKFKVDLTNTYLDYAIVNNDSSEISLSPYFYTLDNAPISTVFGNAGSKYTITYSKYNALSESHWQPLAAPSSLYPIGAGLYKVILTFTEDAEVGDYTIPSGEIITREFQIISAGNLSVNAGNSGVNYYTGNALTPEINFLSSTGDVASLVEGKYTIYYYDLAGKSISQPSAVGKYQFEVKFTTDIPELGVLPNAYYRDFYTIEYRTLSVNFAKNASNGYDVSFIDDITGNALTVTNTIQYFSKVDSVTKALGATAPTNTGKYLCVATMNGITAPIGRSLAEYNISAGDFTFISYTISGSLATATISTANISLTYDGGVKIPTFRFNDDKSVLLNDLKALEDYQISYFKKDALNNWISCGYPLYAGTYKAVATFIKEDPAHGIKAGAKNGLEFTIKQAQISVNYSVAESSADLVYDGGAKTFDVNMIYAGRPYNDVITKTYTGVNTTVYAATPTAPTQVGEYKLSLALTNDKNGSLMLGTPIKDFSITKLQLSADFVVPVSYDAMYTGSAITPVVTFKAINGKYANAESISNANWNSARRIALGYACSYKESTDGINYNDTATIIATNYYQMTVSCNNANVELTATTAKDCSHNMLVSSTSSINEGNAIAHFSIIPCEVKICVEMDEDMYYTGAQKGIKNTAGSIKFFAYNKSTKKHDIEISDFNGDYAVDYYAVGNSSALPNGEPIIGKPTEVSHYVARVKIEPDETNDTYITENRYSLFNGKNSDHQVLSGAALSAGAYVDFRFRILDQKPVDVEFNMPSTFARNDENKTIGVTFIDNTSEITSITYAITYTKHVLDDNNNLVPSTNPDDTNTTSFSAVGKYRACVTFTGDNTMYRISKYQGTFANARGWICDSNGEVFANSDNSIQEKNLYVKSGSKIYFDFEIFEPRVMQVEFTTPSSLYYDGTLKGCAVDFVCTIDGDKSSVLLTSDTHYRLNYYKKIVENDVVTYEKLTSAPIVPGDYAVETEFLTSLYDYKIGDYIIDVVNNASQFATITSKSGNIELATAPHYTYTINKAVLVVSGLTPKNKVFDNSDVAIFDGNIALNVKTVDNVTYGAKVLVNNAFPYALQGDIKGVFASKIPADNIIVTPAETYLLNDDGNAYYDIEYPEYSANIAKQTIRITPIDVTREYNPLAVVSVINYTVTCNETLLTEVCGLAKTAVLKGALAPFNGTAVGKYDIVKGNLEIDDTILTNIDGDFGKAKLTELFAISLDKSTYNIVPRAITIAVKAGQQKVYGDADQKLLLEVTYGSLIYGDTICGDPTRESGENVGKYAVNLSNISIKDSTNADVSSNYNITLAAGNKFEIVKKKITIKPEKQDKTYFQGFDNFAIKVFDDLTSYELTDSYVTNPVGDRLKGKLVTQATSDPLVFNISSKNITVVNAEGKNVTGNYDITRDDRTNKYTITPMEIKVKKASDAILTKYFDDPDPIISYTMVTNKTDLGNLKLSATSGIGRVAGESVGEYTLYKNNNAKSFKILDGDKDVSAYFTITVQGIKSDDRFVILPRKITVTVEDATYDNAGREIIPIIKYINENGTRVSASTLQKLSVKYVLPKVTLVDGENSITPIVSGDVKTDENFDITVSAGTITLNYLENRVTSALVSEKDKMFKDNKYILSGIMLYKTIKLYRLETGNGKQPTHDVDITLNIDETIKGSGIVAVALYSDDSPKAFTFTQKDNSLVYTDDGAYYVAIGQVQEWFYIIWGVVLIFAGVVLFFIVLGFVKVGKKARKKRMANASAREAKKAEMNAKKQAEMNAKKKAEMNAKKQAEIEKKKALEAAKLEALKKERAAKKASLANEVAKPTAEPQSTEEDDMFSSSNTFVEPVKEESKDDLQKEKADATDDLFVSDGPIAETPVVKKAKEEVAIKPAEVKLDKKALKSKEAEEKAAKKAKEAEEKADKKGKEKNAKDDKKGAQKGGFTFTPGAFKPSGNKNTFAPTRSFEDDLFVDETNKANDDMFSDSKISSDDMFSNSKISSGDMFSNSKISSDDMFSDSKISSDDMFSDSKISDDEIVIPKASAKKDDDIIISTGGHLMFDDDDDPVSDDNDEK